MRVAGYLPIIISALLYHFPIRLSRRFSFFIPLCRKKFRKPISFFFQNTLFMGLCHHEDPCLLRRHDGITRLLYFPRRCVLAHAIKSHSIFLKFVQKPVWRPSWGPPYRFFKSFLRCVHRCTNRNQASFWKVAASKEPIAWHTLHTSIRFS